MGRDAIILVRTNDGKAPATTHNLPNDFNVVACAHDDWDVDATHEIDNWARYYGPGYERGPWPTIAAALLTLYAAPNVVAVYYFPDSKRAGETFSLDDLAKFNAHYAKHGTRPYHAPPSHP